jgi:hypothetical protein
MAFQAVKVSRAGDACHNEEVCPEVEPPQIEPYRVGRPVFRE